MTMLGWRQNPGSLGVCWACHALGVPSRETNSEGWHYNVQHEIFKTHQNAPGRPKLTWDELVKRDRVLLGMERTDPEDHQAWRGRLRPRLGSQAAPSAED